MRCLHASWLALLPEAVRNNLIDSLTPHEALALLHDWPFWARSNQLPPKGRWRVWLLLAGRGFGKTRTGAELIRARVAARTARRLALVAPTAADARDVMVEGESGILAISPWWDRPRYEPSKRRLTWPNGAIATFYSADEPERLRGPQHDAAWCDELASWRYPEAWDMLMFGLRLGADPRVVVTTTPRPTTLIRALVADPAVAVTRGTTYENRPNLAPDFIDQIVRKYQGTRLGRQEIDAEILDDVPGGLWKRGIIEARRTSTSPPLARVVVAIDPAATSGGCRRDRDHIAGKDGEGHGWVLADLSGRYPPSEWAKTAVTAYTASRRPGRRRSQQWRRHGRGDAAGGRPEPGRYARSERRAARSPGPNRWRHSMSRAECIISAPSRNSRTRCSARSATGQGGRVLARPGRCVGLGVDRPIGRANGRRGNLRLLSAATPKGEAGPAGEPAASIERSPSVTLLVKDANTTVQSLSTEVDSNGSLVPVHAPAATARALRRRSTAQRRCR